MARAWKPDPVMEHALVLARHYLDLWDALPPRRKVRAAMYERDRALHHQLAITESTNREGALT